MSVEELYTLIAKAIVDDGWSPIKVTRDGVTHDCGEYAPNVYWNDELCIPEVEDASWHMVEEFHPSESLTEARHIEYHMSGDVEDVVEFGSTLYIVCAEIVSLDGGDFGGLGWELLSKVAS